LSGPRPDEARGGLGGETKATEGEQVTCRSEDLEAAPG
jgi:hypothetical protein